MCPYMSIQISKSTAQTADGPIVHEPSSKPQTVNASRHIWDKKRQQSRNLHNCSYKSKDLTMQLPLA